MKGGKNIPKEFKETLKLFFGVFVVLVPAPLFTERLAHGQGMTVLEWIEKIEEYFQYFPIDVPHLILLDWLVFVYFATIGLLPKFVECFVTALVFIPFYYAYLSWKGERLPLPKEPRSSLDFIDSVFAAAGVFVLYLVVAAALEYFLGIDTLDFWRADGGPLFRKGWK